MFLLFLDTFHLQGDLSFPLFPDTSTEPSAAGARRGVCNCIQTTILLGPPAEGRPGPSDDDDDDDDDDDERMMMVRCLHLLLVEWRTVVVHPIIGINVQLDQLDIHTDTNVYCMLHSTFYFTLHIAHYIYIAPYILHRTSHFRLHLSGSNIQLDQPIRHTCRGYNFSSTVLQFALFAIQCKEMMCNSF